MAFSPAALRNLFRRDTVQDPFGGDDMYDGESRFAGKGPKIALAASGVLFIALIGGVAAIVMTQEQVAPPVLGSLADLEVVEDTEPAPAATDRSVERRPWLAAAVTLAFSPYTRNLKMWVETAKAKGQKVLIEVPMESKQFPAEDPGPLGLLTSMEAKDNQDRLDAILKDATGAVGAYDDMGSKFRESSEHINTVFAKLKTANLFYVQGTQRMGTGEASVPTATADIIIDERPFRAAIDARLDYAERLANYQGSTIVALSAKPVSFERLVLWLAQAQKKGVVLAPVSQVLIKTPDK